MKIFIATVALLGLIAVSECRPSSFGSDGSATADSAASAAVQQGGRGRPRPPFGSNPEDQPQVGFASPPPVIVPPPAQITVVQPPPPAPFNPATVNLQPVGFGPGRQGSGSSVSASASSSASATNNGLGGGASANSNAASSANTFGRGSASASSSSSAVAVGK